MGSGCGSVGRMVASDTRDLWFESRHRQNCIYQLYNRKDKNKEKEAGNGISLKNINSIVSDDLYLTCNLRRFLFFGTMERYRNGTEQ